MFHRQAEPASEQVAATIRVRDPNSNHLTVIETWRPAGGWLGRLGLAAERRFKLSTGEAVEQAADNVFVQLESLEILIRVRQPPARDVQPENARARSSRANARRPLPVHES